MRQRLCRDHVTDDRVACGAQTTLSIGTRKPNHGSSLDHGVAREIDEHDELALMFVEEIERFLKLQRVDSAPTTNDSSDSIEHT